MTEGLSVKESNDILLRLRDGNPPKRMKSIFVETRAAREILDDVQEKVKTISEGTEPAFLIMRATRGAGKTAMIRYLKEELGDRVFFVDLERFYTSGQDLFHQFVDAVGKSVMTEAVRNISLDPIKAYKVLSEEGHNGTAIALAGLLEDSPDAWNWLCSRASFLPRLKCGLKLVRNVRDVDALDALAAVVRVLARRKPVVLAIDELELTFNELGEKQRSKLRSLLVGLINCQKFSKILFLFAATDNVYQMCFRGKEAAAMGLLGKTEGATVPLDLPEKREVARILERILGLYAHARKFAFSKVEILEIKQEYVKAVGSALPRDIILYALRKGDEKWESLVGFVEIKKALEEASAKIIQESDIIRLGKKFEEAVGVLLAFTPGREIHLPQPDVTEEVERLKRQISGLGEIQKWIDWLLRINGKNIWIEVCITMKKDSALPSRKALAVLAKTLYDEGSFGLFVTHNFERFPAGGKITKVILRFLELRDRIDLMNLDEEEFRLLIGILGIDKEIRPRAAEFLLERTGFVQKIDKLMSDEYSFW
jgi:hypothetical protein